MSDHTPEERHYEYSDESAKKFSRRADFLNKKASGTKIDKKVQKAFQLAGFHAQGKPLDDKKKAVAKKMSVEHKYHQLRSGKGKQQQHEEAMSGKYN